VEEPPKKTQRKTLFSNTINKVPQKTQRKTLFSNTINKSTPYEDLFELV